jgi:hypothetical protein
MRALNKHVPCGYITISTQWTVKTEFTWRASGQAQRRNSTARTKDRLAPGTSAGKQPFMVTSIQLFCYTSKRLAFRRASCYLARSPWTQTYHEVDIETQNCRTALIVTVNLKVTRALMSSLRRRKKLFLILMSSAALRTSATHATDFKTLPYKKFLAKNFFGYKLLQKQN